MPTPISMAAHDERIAPCGLGLLVEEQAQRRRRERLPIASSHSSARLCFSSAIAAVAHPEALGDDLHPVAKEIDQYGQQRAHVQRDVEGQRLGLPAEQPGSEIQVRRAADGQEFGKALDNGEQNDLVEGHQYKHEW